VLGKWTQVEAWCAANPKRAFVYNFLRGSGFDFRKVIQSIKTYAESKADVPPRFETKENVECVGDMKVRTETVKKITLIAGLFVALLVSGCAATFEESTGKIQVAGARKAAADPVLCSSISARARWEKALAATGAALTGASGIATWPVRSDDGKVGLAIASGVLAGGTVLVLALWEADAAEYISAGCAQPKAAP
jgi:hypothetical protein